MGVKNPDGASDPGGKLGRKVSDLRRLSHCWEKATR